MKLDRVQKKGENFPSQEYDKDRIVQYKKRKATLPRIAFPAKMNTSEEELSVDTYPIEQEESANDIKDDKNKIYDEDEESECPDDTSTVEMEEGVIDKKDESLKI